MGKVTTKEGFYEQTKRIMKNLGTYKQEYLPLIDIYAELRAEYLILYRDYVNGGYEYSEASAAGTGKKSPIVATLESLRKDILAYSDRLMLNPKSLSDKAALQTKKHSALAEALKEVEQDL